MGQKRRRIALSCVDCRRRKVKCDRTYPSCVRCQKGGYGEKCTYVTHTGEPHDPGLPTPEDDRESLRRSVRESSWAQETDQWQHSARANAVATTSTAATEADKGIDAQLPPPPQRLPVAPPRLTADAKERKIVQLQSRLMDLETYVYSAGGKPIFSDFNLGLANPAGPSGARPRNPYSDTALQTESEKVLMRGKSFKTQYFGPSHDLSILLQFEELSKFVKDILLALPSLSNAKRSLAEIRDKEKKAVRAQYDLSIETLVAMVPDRAFCDRLLHEYLNDIETTYRILHVPSFLQEYEAYWNSPKNARPEFIIQLLLAMSTIYCVVPGGEEGFVGRSSARRDTAQHWVNVCQNWVDLHSFKHVDMAYYQILVLLWFARRMNCIKVKREWTNIGHLVRFFTAAGMHRDPGLLSNKISIFGQEMRRRLWYTVVSIDHQTTVDRGMTPSIGPLDWDTAPPRNIDDEAFDSNSEHLPESKPRNVFTRTSFLAWMAENLPMCIEMLYKINSIRSELDLETVLQYDSRVRECLDDLPTAGWEASAVTNTTTSMQPPMYPNSAMNTPAATSVHTASPHAGRNASGISHPGTPSHTSSTGQFAIDTKIACTLPQLMLHELTTILHQPFAALSTTTTTEAPKSSLTHRHFLSRAARRSACMSTLYLYSPLDPSDPSAGNLSSLQSRFLASLRECHSRASLSLAHDLAISSALSHSASDPYATQDTRRAVGQIDATVRMLDDRVRNLGQGFHCYWIVSSALSFVHAKQNPDVPRNTFARAAADRVVKLHDAVLAGQLPRARRMLTHTAEDLNAVSAKERNFAMQGFRNAGQGMEAVSSVDGAITIQDGGPEAAIEGEIGVGLEGVLDPLVGDGMFGLENFDWTAIMNADPMSFMGGGGWDMAA